MALPTDPAALDNRPAEGEEVVRSLLERLQADGSRDLGGTMSLNLHIEREGKVVRIHRRSASRSRIQALRALRRHLAEGGLTVGVPVPLFGADILRVGPYLAEAETYIDHFTPSASRDAYLWMYQTMGDLHRRTTSVTARLPRPAVATYGPPSSLRRWFRTSIQAVAEDDDASRTLEWAITLMRKLETQWVNPATLPRQIIHGDIRLGNVAETPESGAAYLDFGFAAHRPRVYELAYSLIWIILRPDGQGRAEDFDWTYLQELVDAYESAAGVRLEQAERAAIGPFTAAVPLYQAAIAGCGFISDPAEHLRGETNFLRIAQWLLENPDAPLANMS